MPTLTFYDIGLAENPSIDDFIDPEGTVTLDTDTQYEITNNSGPWAGYRVRLTHEPESNGSQFIEKVDFLAPDGVTVFATLERPQVYPYENPMTLSDFLGSPSAARMMGGGGRITGSDVSERITTAFTYGSTTIDGRGGDDLITITYGPTNVAGGLGDDVIRITSPHNYSHSVAGSSANGDGGEGEHNTLEIGAGFLKSVFDIDALVLRGAVRIAGSQVTEGGLSSHLAVSGSGSLRIEGYGVPLDFSGWTIAPGTTASIILKLGNSEVSFVGSDLAEDVDTDGDHDDSLDGGGGADVIRADNGDDVIRGARGETRCMAAMVPTRSTSLRAT